MIGHLLKYVIIINGDDMDGILLIDKPAKMTSHDVVARLRSMLHIKKIGHSGTLDPDARGVLLVLVGKATKILPYMEDTDKEYIAEMELGKRTLSDDVFGEVLETKEIFPIHDLSALASSFVGKQKQLPPMISSVRVNGRKLYEYARKNETVDRPLRDIEIYEIEVLDVAKMQFRVFCSSGTYIRSLCRDIAEKSGNLGCMTSLIRTKVGRFSLADCVTLDDVAQGHCPIHTINEALQGYPTIEYSPIDDIYHGKTICIPHSADMLAITHEGVIIAMYKRNHGSWFSCARGLW